MYTALENYTNKETFLFGTEKTPYSYTADAVWNNKNDQRKSIGISKSDNVMKKMVLTWREIHNFPSVWKMTNNLAFRYIKVKVKHTLILE